MLLLACCGGEPDPLEAIALEARPALRLLRLASVGETGIEALADLVRPDLLQADPTGLLDSLGAVGPAEGWEVLAVEPLPDLRRVAVDLQATGAGGATAVFTVQTEADPRGEWRVVWLAGPGLQWPARSLPRGEALSSSAPPDSD